MEIRIIHVLSNGTELKDIKGHVIKKEDAPTVYQVLEQIRKEKKWASSMKI